MLRRLRSGQRNSDLRVHSIGESISYVTVLVLYICLVVVGMVLL